MAGKIVKIILLLLIILLVGCDSYELFDLLGSTGAGASGEGEPLSIVPISATLEVGTEFTFTAAGGILPYIFSVVSGAGSINSESGVYTAPVEASIDIVQVADGEGSQSQARIVVVY
jgi:hypothetical protein